MKTATQKLSKSDGDTGVRDLRQRLERRAGDRAGRALRRPRDRRRRRRPACRRWTYPTARRHSCRPCRRVPAIRSRPSDPDRTRRRCRISARQEQIPSTGQRHGNSRRAEVEVRAGIPWAVEFVATAGAVENITGRDLLRPDRSPRRKIQRDDRVAQLGGWMGIVVAGGDVDQVALHIHRRRRPDADTRRSHHRQPRAFFAVSLGTSHQIGFPQHLSVADAQRHDAAAERAAGIPRIAGACLLPGGHRDVDHAVVRGGRAREPRRIMCVDPRFPEQLPRFRVDRVEPAGHVAEQQRMPCRAAQR